MPFRSRAQRAWMHANKPTMAALWEKETPSGAALPEHAPKKGKVKKAEPGPPPGMSMEEWDRHLNPSPGRLKKADFPNAAGPEDWDTVGTSGQIARESGASKAKSDVKEKVSQGDDVFDNDGTRIMPYIRHIHKLGHLKMAQGFEYADVGPNAGEIGPPVHWRMPGKLKRSAGLDQEEGLDDPEPGVEPPAAFPQPKSRLEALAASRGPIRKVSQASWRALLDEMAKMGRRAGVLAFLLALLFPVLARAADPDCRPQDYTKAKPVPNFACPGPLEDSLVPDLESGPKASIKLLTGKPAPWDGILMDSDRVIQLGLRIKAIRRLRWNDTLTMQDKMAAEVKLVEDSKTADVKLLQSQRESYKQQLVVTQKELDKANAWYRSWTFGLIVGVVTTSATAVALAYLVK